MRELHDNGVNVGLGVDGLASNDASNLVQGARQPMQMQQVANGADAMGSRKAPEIATRGGAQIPGRDDWGQFAVGKRTDIAIRGSGPRNA